MHCPSCDALARNTDPECWRCKAPLNAQSDTGTHKGITTAPPIPQSAASRKRKRKSAQQKFLRFTTWTFVFILLVGAGGALGYQYYEKEKEKNKIREYASGQTTTNVTAEGFIAEFPLQPVHAGNGSDEYWYETFGDDVVVVAKFVLTPPEIATAAADPVQSLGTQTGTSQELEDELTVRSAELNSKPVSEVSFYSNALSEQLFRTEQDTPAFFNGVLMVHGENLFLVGSFADSKTASDVQQYFVKSFRVT